MILRASSSMMAGSDAAPSKGRIQKRKTNPLQIVKSSLQRTAGPYKGASSGSDDFPRDDYRHHEG